MTAEFDEELIDLLTAEANQELRRYRDHIRKPNVDRTHLLTAHLVVERLLVSMIATQLPEPYVWLHEADFRSCVNLARALRLIGDKELNICRVLNSARNSVAHSLEPLPDKWKLEIQRLAFGRKANETSKELGNESEHLKEALEELVTWIAAPFLYASFHFRRQELSKQHKERWIELMKAKLEENPHLFDLPENDPAREQLEQQLARDVNVALAKELREAKAKEPSNMTGTTHSTGAGG